MIIMPKLKTTTRVKVYAETKAEYNTLDTKEIQVSETSKIVFSAATRNNEDISVDVRLHVTGDRYTGLTKKGVTFTYEDLNEVIEILTKFRDDYENYEFE